MSVLKLAPGLALDADYVGGGTFSLLAKKGAGKTYLGRVIAEEFWKAKVPFVALDPMDAWWGLRSSADGEGEGIPVAIFGGEHGDAPLERTSGKLMADLVVDEGLSMVLSLKHFGSRSAERQFALDFLERLYRQNSELVHLLIDEADLFAPQKPQAGDAPLLGVTENIVRRGRNSGIGITLITQRPAVLNKDVLTQVDGLCVMRMLGPQDRNAIDAWVGEHGDEKLGKEVKGSLPDLPTGECWWWVPELGVLKRVKIRASDTFDSSPTRKRGSKDREPRSYADVDMAAIETKMAETIERAKAEDPKELRKRIAELQKELQRRPTEVETKVETVTEQVEVPVFNGEVDRLEEIVKQLVGFGQQITDAADSVAGAIAEVKPRMQGERRGEALRPQTVSRPPARRPASTAAPIEPSGEITHPQQRILDALAWLEATLGYESASRIQVGFLAAYKPTSGNFNNLLGQLKSTGLVDYPRPGFVALTNVGREAANDPGGPGTTEELQEAVLAKLTGPQAKILRALIDAHDEGPLSREELGERVDYSPSSGNFNNLVGSLKSLGIVSYPERGWVQAEPVLFLEEAYV